MLRAPAESVSSSTSSMLPRTSPSPPEPGVTSGPEPEVERMMTAPRGPPPDPAQGQMLLQFGGYVEQQLHPLRLDIQINRDDIIKFGSVDFSLTNLSSIKPDCTDLIDSDSINIDFTIYWSEKAIKDILKWRQPLSSVSSKCLDLCRGWKNRFIWSISTNVVQTDITMNDAIRNLRKIITITYITFLVTILTIASVWIKRSICSRPLSPSTTYTDGEWGLSSRSLNAFIRLKCK